MRVVKRIWVSGKQVTKLLPKGRVYKNLNKKTKNMEKLELKLKNLELFVIRLKDITTEEMIELLKGIGEIKKKVQKFKKGNKCKQFDPD